MNCREAMGASIDYHTGQARGVQETLKLIEDKYPDLLEIPGARILMGWWIAFRADGPGLASRVASILNVDAGVGRYGNLREFKFKVDGLRVDVECPMEGCKTARVRRKPSELTMTFCGDIPSEYELIEYIEEPSDEGQ